MRRKTCNKCKKRKYVTEFFVDKRDGSRRGRCKECTNEEHKAWTKANPEKHRAIFRRSNHKANLRSRFGLSVEQFDSLVTKHGEKCAVCKMPESRDRRLSLDHCHRTGLLRGFLCSRCNLIIGNAGDDPNRLRCAADYLERPVIGVLPVDVEPSRLEDAR